MNPLPTTIYNNHATLERRRALRKDMPPAEVLMWSRLRGGQMLGSKYRRQYAIGPYIIDFYCPALKLAIEIDGDSHSDEDRVLTDRKRQSYIESFGITVLRFTNQQVYQDLHVVLETIFTTMTRIGHQPPPTPPYQGGEL